MTCIAWQGKKIACSRHKNENRINIKKNTFLSYIHIVFKWMIQCTKCICLFSFCQRSWNLRHIMYGRMKMFCKNSLHLCWFCFYKRFIKKRWLWEFPEIYIVGTQRVSQESDTAERTAIEISELFHVMAFLQKGTSSRHFQIASLLNMKLCSDFII